CPRCKQVGGWLLELHEANALPPVFGLIDAALARSRAEAPRLLEELLTLNPEERLTRLHADRRFVSWGLCELLVRRSCQAAPEQPSEAIHLADLAVHVADRISDATSSRNAGSISSGASAGPASATAARCRAISPEPRGASPWPTPRAACYNP